MVRAPIPANDEARLQALYEYEILDTEPEQEYDEIVKLLSDICEIPTAHISLIDKDRQFLKAKVGLGVQNLDRGLTFCAHAILQDDVLVVEDATKDHRFFDSPLVANDPCVRFYAGMPLIVGSGYKIGTLCVIDNQPHQLTTRQLYALRTISKQVIKQFELRKNLKKLKSQHLQLEEINAINNRLLTIIGHDIRSPLASLAGMMDVMASDALNKEEFLQLSNHIRKTLLNAEGMLHDLLQWASSQKNGSEPLPINIHLFELVEEIVRKHEVEFGQKNNKISNSMDPAVAVNFDKNALQFVLRNLILNANKFTEGGVIRVGAQETIHGFEIEVRDTGVGMPPEKLQHLFDWNKRNSSPGTRGELGSGLALLLCHDLLLRQGGSLSVKSKLREGTLFTICIPTKAA